MTPVLILYSLADEEEQIGALIVGGSGTRHTRGILHDWEDGFLIHCDLDVNVQALLVGNLFTRTEANTTFLRGLNLIIHRKFDAKTFARFKHKNLSTYVERTAKQHIVKKKWIK